MFERLLKTTEDTEAHERGGAVPRAVCRAFDAVRGPPLQKPRVVTASGHAGAADIRAAVRAGPASSFKRLRELSERHKREDADIRAAVRRARAARRAVQRRPAWRPREGGARMVAASGRDGSGKRDDGSGDGDSDGDGGGGGEPPGPRTHAPFSGGVR